LNGFKELLQPTTLGDLVAGVETEVIAKHVFPKPNLQENNQFTKCIFTTSSLREIIS